MLAMKETFIFNDPKEKPKSESEGDEYILLLHWLPEENRSEMFEDCKEEYYPCYSIGLWRDGKWWETDNMHEGDEDATGLGGVILRPIDFTPIDNDLLLGWCPIGINHNNRTND